MHQTKCKSIVHTVEKVRIFTLCPSSKLIIRLGRYTVAAGVAEGFSARLAGRMVVARRCWIGIRAEAEDSTRLRRENE